ncbi:hypothetical protein D1007_07831 [Hordeum vulgare]|nr:hypothetical protein D1007_07831 [Hordeum vulgare]
MVWTREAKDGGQNSSKVDPRQGGSDKARWEAADMETQGGARGEKWGNSSAQVAAGGTAGGRQQDMRQQQVLHQPPERRHPTPGKRNVSPLVGGAEGAKGVLNVAWVNVGKIPLDKRHERNIAYVGSLVGVTLEIDKATINRPKSVRIKLGCRDAEDIPASAEGVLGGHFYDFFFSVDKILVKNPPREKITVQQETEEGNTAKKARFNTDARVERNIASSSNMGESLAPPRTAGGGYGKNMVINPVEENIEEEKNKMIVRRCYLRRKVKKWIVPSSASGKIFSSYLEACMGEPVVTEIDPNESSGQQKMQSYSVQSPDNSCEKVEVIPTPPVREEMQVRFRKRNVGANVEHVGVRAERMAQKKDLQVKKTSPGNSFEVLSNLEIISDIAQMGVSIPDDNFESIDIISELEISRANIAKKVDKNDKQQDKMLFITNAAREASPLDTEWVGDEDLDVNDFTIVRSRKKESKKVNITITKHVTRSQKQKVGDDAGKAMAPGKPSTKTQLPKNRKND